MGFFSKLGSNVPSGPENSMANNQAVNIDTEKQETAELDSRDTGPRGAIPFTVTPEMEKTVVRKLDKRLVPLVMGLCRTAVQGLITFANIFSRSPRIPR
jgi:hypothetical protein